MSNTAVCWQCGASLAELTLPLSRTDYCRHCRAELHVCRLCRFYDVTVASQCREPVAEEVRDKQRANYCDYFSPRNDAFMPPATAAAQQAKARLDELFGQSAAPAVAAGQDSALVALNDLFGSRKS